MKRMPAVAAALVAALLASLVYFNVCRHTGRLSQEMVHDDVGYAVDAATRYDLGLDHGIVAVARDLWSKPPSSPYQTFLGMVAFTFGGVDEASLYAANAWILLAVAALVAWHLRAARVATLAVALALLMTAPLAFFSINEFRPDIALGLAMAAMAWWFLDAFTERRRTLFAAAGLAFAAALLIKPTFFAHTFAIAGWLFLLAVAGTYPSRWQWFPADAAVDRRRRRETAGDLALFLGAGVVIALPYAITGGRLAFDHFWTNTRGSLGKFWSYSADLTLSERVGFLFGDLQQLNPQVTVACAFAALVFAALLWRQGATRDARRLLAFLSVGLVSVGIMFVGNHRSPFFYATAHWIAMLGAVRGFAMVVERPAARGRLAMLAFAALGIAFLFALNGARSYWGKPSPGIRNGAASNMALVDTVWADLAARGERPGEGRDRPRVLVIAWGDVNGTSMEWSALRSGRPIEGLGLAYEGGVDAAYIRAQSSDYVVVSNPLVANYRHDLPDGRMQPALAARLFGDHDFALISPSGADRAYFVLANQPRLAARGSRPVVRMDAVPIDIGGLGPQEGPYPRRSLPLPALRWMLGREAYLCFASAAGPALLALDYYSNDEATLTAKRDEVVVGETHLAKGFGTARWPLERIAGGQCLRLAIRTAPGVAPGPVVFFTRLELAPSP